MRRPEPLQRFPTWRKAHRGQGRHQESRRWTQGADRRLSTDARRRVSASLRCGWAPGPEVWQGRSCWLLGAEPAGRSGGEVGMDVLGLLVFGESFGAEFPPDPRLLVPAPRRLRKVRVEVVDPHGPEPECCSGPLRPNEVLRPHRTGKAVVGVIRSAHGFPLGCETLNGENRPENLLAQDAHAGLAP